MPAIGKSNEGIAGKPAPTRSPPEPWPVALPQQVAAVARILAASPVPLGESDVDAQGQIVAMTIEHARERADIPQFSFEQVAA